MKQTEMLTMLEIELNQAWSKAMKEKRQEKHRELRAKALDLYNLIKKTKIQNGLN